MKNLNLCTDLESFVVIEKINEGYSGDDKYKVQKDGKFFVACWRPSKSNGKGSGI